MADAHNSHPSLVDGNALVAKSLAQADVAHMFGVVGIPVTAVATRAVALGIRFIAFHNEQSAGYAASAYGYLSGRPGIMLTVIKHAYSGRPGGCYLDLPSDVLHQTITESEAEKLLIEAKNCGEEPVIETANPSEIAKAVSLLRKAERPLIVFGKGAAISRAEME
ncbi:unnamed protein product [Thlaspi arvense]|uniref:Thiamine pyrophosphate enzyme N-terminal TPP-binding domain-containing protein n=1 Tax=Thlaspi arvense TaxID=13288 RepID=A0AAU9S2Y5_THLAR|nr:unnamed protein product [Thlaspi arvense]